MSRLLTILSISKLTSWEKHEHIGVYLSLSGGARGRVIPSSIPNLEVKPPIADNTAGYACGNVGRCHFEFITHFLTFTITSFTLINELTSYHFMYYLAPLYDAYFFHLLTFLSFLPLFLFFYCTYSSILRMI